MTRREFEQLVTEEFPRAVPEKFHDRIKNVAILVEDEPTSSVRKRESLAEGETLLGYYQGIPNTARGADYGVGMVLPDTITLYQRPIEDAASADGDVARVIRETIWHEIAHYFGFGESEVEKREQDARDPLHR